MLRRPISYHTTSLCRNLTTTSSAASRMAASPFTRAVISSMRTLYPECLADKSFDNTGLLLEAPFLPFKRNRNSVLLTIDLIKAVADEAIENKHSVVIAYHPIIFRGLKAITLDDSQQQSLLKLAANGISVYSPHTAMDVVPGGMGDWLCDIVAGKPKSPEPEEAHSTGPQSPASETDVTTSTSESESKPSTKSNSPSIVGQEAITDPFTPDTPRQNDHGRRRPSGHHRTYSKPIYPQIDISSSAIHQDTLEHTRRVITPSPKSALETANSQTSKSDQNQDESQKTNPTPYYKESNTGAGRIITFTTPQPLTLLISRIGHAIGLPKGFPIAIPQSSSLESLQIKTLALCPGSGSHIFKTLLSQIQNNSQKPDLLFTGELTHHDALYFTEREISIITLFHSNSERGYLDAVMRPKLYSHLSQEWESLRQEMKRSDSAGESGIDGLEEILEDDSCEVVVSERDRDPYGIVVLEESQVEGVDL